MQINKKTYQAFIYLPILGWIILNIYFAFMAGGKATTIFFFASIAYIIPHLLYAKRAKDSQYPLLWSMASIVLVSSAIAGWFFIEHHGWLIFYGPPYYLAMGAIIWVIAMLINATLYIKEKVNK